MEQEREVMSKCGWTIKPAKPSEQFPELLEAAQAMEDGKDRSDLLYLFAIADRLHEKVEAFDDVIRQLRINEKRFKSKIEKELAQMHKWTSLLEFFDRRRTAKVINMDTLKETAERRR